MAVLVKGVDFTTGQQVTATNLDNLVDAATFDTGAVDNATTQLSGGAIIVKDGGITSAKLATNIAVAGTLSATGLVTFDRVTSIGATTPGSGAFTTMTATTQTRAQNGSIGLLLGADNAAGTLTDATTKVARLGVPHYTNSEEPFGAFVAQSTSTDNLLNIGGGSALINAATLVSVLCAANNTTVTGTSVANFTSSGLQLPGLAGVGTRAVVSDASGNLSTGTVAVASGGTGATDAATARTNLGLAIGTNVQAYNANLTTYAGIAPSANVQSFLGAADYSAMRTQLSLVVGTNVQAFDADLSALAALSGTNTIYYRSAASTWSAVTVGSGLSFSGGTLSSTVSGIGGSTGATDNRILRADGTGGSTLQNSAVSIDDSGNVTGAATYDAGTGGYKVSGTKVLGAQSSAEADIALSTSIAGSDTVDAATIAANFGSLNGKINSILAKIRTHGIFAT